MTCQKRLDSIHKQKRRIDFCEKVTQIYQIFVAMATRVGPTTFCMVPLNWPSPKTPYQAQTSPFYLPYKPSYSRFLAEFWGVNFWGQGPKSKIEEQRFVEGSGRTNGQKMARFHRKTKKKKQFEFFEKNSPNFVAMATNQNSKNNVLQLLSCRTDGQEMA